MTPTFSYHSVPEDFPRSVVCKEPIDYRVIGNKPGCNPSEFDGIRMQNGLNSFVLTNLDSLNSVLIRQGLPQPECLLKLNEIAITQMRTLLSTNNVKRLK